MPEEGLQSNLQSDKMCPQAIYSRKCSYKQQGPVALSPAQYIYISSKAVNGFICNKASNSRQTGVSC